MSSEVRYGKMQRELRKSISEVKRKLDKSQRSKREGVSDLPHGMLLRAHGRVTGDLHKGWTGVVGRTNGCMLMEVIQQQEEIDWVNE